MSTIKRIRHLVHNRQVKFTDHAFEEMDNDNLTLKQIQTILLNGMLLRQLDDDERGIRYVIQG